MPTYTEHLFEPLEAWIERLDQELELGLRQEKSDELRLIVSKMLLEHSGRGDRPVVKS